ncbi:polyhydroxyalkanoic acid system family protein [Sphingomonas sp. IW22]|uniref:polyhydroxyalkanoic acid system family protein n=1 Tax=Sphingomonas sp. IW22 TaxID=3242489 RepID=UPI0035206A1B
MSDPVTVEIPHQLSNDDLRQRIDGGIGKLGAMIPGGEVVEHHWESDRLMTVTMQALGQRVAAKIELLEGRVRAEVDLPPMLALFADKIRAKLVKDGPSLLK